MARHILDKCGKLKEGGDLKRQRKEQTGIKYQV